MRKIAMLSIAFMLIVLFLILISEGTDAGEFERVEITPWPSTNATTGDIVGFSAVAYNWTGNVSWSWNPVWIWEGSGLGPIDTTDPYNVTVDFNQAGSDTINVSIESQPWTFNTTDVVVSAGSVVWIEITPWPSTTNTTDDLGIFTVVGYDADGNVNWSWTPDWSWIGTGLGTINDIDPFNVTVDFNLIGVDTIHVEVLGIPAIYNGTDVTVLDTEPPSITDVASTPDPQEIFENVNISAIITDNDNVYAAWVNITYPDSSYVNILMNKAPGDIFYFNQSYNQIGTYDFTISANDTSDNFNESTTGMFQIIATAPDAPTGLTATPGDSFINLAWDVPASDGGSPITDYTIYRGVDGVTFTVIAEIGNTLYYNDTSVTNSITYYYKVSAVNAIGEGAPSNEVSTTPSIPINFPPICIISYPSPEETISGTCEIFGNASDPNNNLEMVEIKIDGGSWVLVTDTSGNGTWSTWNYIWDTGEMADGQHTIYARASDSGGGYDTVIMTVTVDNTLTAILVTIYLNPRYVGPGASIEVYGNATYNTGGPVADAEVNLSIMGSNDWWITTTNSSGDYLRIITAPSVNGTYLVRVNVTKDTLSAQTQQNLEVTSDPLPDLAISSSDIAFDPSTPYSGETVQIQITVRNNGIGDADDVTVSVYDGDPDEGGVLIYSYEVNVLASEITSENLSWITTDLSGTHYVYVILDLDDSIAESDETNNRASRLINISTEEVDSDGDGVIDVSDAFPLDPSASIDSDGDGYPDSWNTDKSQLDSTTGLKLDVFPNDPKEWADTDEDGIGDNSDFLPNFNNNLFYGIIGTIIILILTTLFIIIKSKAKEKAASKKIQSEIIELESEIQEMKEKGVKTDELDKTLKEMKDQLEQEGNE